MSRRLSINLMDGTAHPSLSVARITRWLRDSIEEESPLPFELRLRGIEFVVDEDTLLVPPENPVRALLGGAVQRMEMS